MARRLGVLLVAFAVLAAGAADAGAVPRKAKARLASFDSCAQLVRYARAHAGRMQASGVPGPPPLVRPAPPPLAPMPELREGQNLVSPAAAAPGAGGDASTSTTNVQEAGVDEPDVVKTDGRIVYVVSASRLLAIDVAGGAPRLLATVPLTGWSHELLLHDERLLVLSRVPGPGAEAPGPPRPDAPRPSTVAASPALPYRGATRLAEVAVGDPAAPRVVRTQDVEGDYVTARLHDGAARVVVTSAPERLTGRRAADWVPQTVVASAGRPARPARLLVPCDDVARPATFSGLTTVTVLTVDLRAGLPAVDADAILSSAQTVYASPRSVYVATQRDLEPAAAAAGEPPALSSAIHRFDTSERRSTTYRSSGTVTGTLLNQFSLSEHGGVLRAATTDWPLWWGPEAPARESESFVTTLTERDGQLVRTGRVDGLGRTERIYAVRFVGDVGYVVTFRQTDPLYTLDLADPARPRVLGELEVPGYSAYLHPVGEDLVLGVGQDATEDGRRTGAQVSLFDVRDLRAPRRLGQVGFGPGSFSAVEGDHRAFLHWPATGLAVVPLVAYGSESSFAGAVGLRVGRARGVAEVGRVEHGGERLGVGVQRSLVVGGRLVTVSDEGLEVGRLDTLAEQAFLAFPPPAR
jgi:uncharacterized secreted protein with C-terminal beta-propeller domain